MKDTERPEYLNISFQRTVPTQPTRAISPRTKARVLALIVLAVAYSFFEHSRTLRHHDMGRTAYLASQAKLFDRFYASPPSRAKSLVVGTFVACASVGVYELLALAIYALLQAKHYGSHTNIDSHGEGLHPATPQFRLKRLLRVFVLSEVVVVVAFVVAEVASRGQLPTEIRDFATAQDARLRASASLQLGALIVMALTVLSWVGLWRLWVRGRTIFSAAWVISLGFLFFMGPYIHSSLAEVLSDLTVAVNGLIFGLLYFSDLRHTFRKQVASENVPTA